MRRVLEVLQAVSWSAVIAALLVVAAAVCQVLEYAGWPALLVKAAIAFAVLSLRGPLDALVAELRIR